MQQKLTISELKPGDEIRVAFNSKTLEWPDGEAPIEVVFMLYRLSDIEAGE